MSASPKSTQSLIDELVRATGAADATEAIRVRARELISTFVAAFGEPTMPVDMNVLTSLRGIRTSDERPFHSPDAELSPDGSGGVTMRVNPDRPETRQRFSIAHEITHTFFPEYTTKEWCRTDARYRDRSNPDEHLEMLCDIGAAELLFPHPWFARDCQQVQEAAGLIDLAKTYQASREATIRRFAEISPDPIAAVFFAWKLKPTQKGTVGRKEQTNLFGISPEEERLDALRLRIEYSIPSPDFRNDGHFLPKDKSVESDGPLYLAASTGQPAHGECYLDLGQASGTYRIMAVPLWTPDENLGANGENGVAAIIRPLSVRKPKRKKTNTPNLFDNL